MDDFSVGQILFVLMSEENQVLPVKVIERVTRETSLGETRMYIVVTGVDDKQYDLSKIKGRPFINPDDVRVEMLTNVTRVIDKIISRAQMIASTKLDVIKVINQNVEKSSDID